MVDITHKSSTLRIATAQAVVRTSSEATIKAIREGKVPKGDVFEMAKVAGLFAVKRTHDMIPDCHPLPIEYAHISYEIKDVDIYVYLEVKTIYKTGVEVEAMHGASVVALTMYDMLKPIDKGIEIQQIKLLHKKGGKTDYKHKHPKNLKAAVIVCSDSIAAGKKQDKAGKAIVQKLDACAVAIHEYSIIADEVSLIQEKVNSLQGQAVDLIIFTGGTGLSPRDVTPEAILPLLDRNIPGIAEAIRAYGQERTPYSMLSRSVAGTIGASVVLCLPGSTKGASESMEALFPALLHIFAIMRGAQH